MPGFLRQSTDSQTRILGPFHDDTDFKSLETGLTIANTDIKLSKNGGSSVNKNSGGGTHIVNGEYAVTYDATDTGTVGQLRVSCLVSGALLVWDTFTVLEEAVYDALFAASAPGYVANAPVNVAQFGGSNGTFSSGIPAVNTTLIEGSDATNQIRDAVVDDATRIDASALNTLSGHDPGETIMGATDLGTGSGLTSLASAASLATVAGYVDTEVGAIKAVTDKLDDTLEDQGGGTYGFTEASLQEAPSGTGASAATIAAAVWNSEKDDYTTPDTFGAYLDSAISGVSTGGVSAGDIADAVLDEALAGHTTGGTLGKAIADILVDTAEIGTAGAGLTEAGGTGDQLTAIPWNSSWDAEVQSECADALAAYDPATYTETVSLLAGLNDLSAAEVNAEVVDAISVDTYSYPSVGAPPSSNSLVGMARYSYSALINPKDNDNGTTNNFYRPDGTTVIWKQDTSVSGGVVTVGAGESG